MMIGDNQIIFLALGHAREGTLAVRMAFDVVAIALEQDLQKITKLGNVVGVKDAQGSLDFAVEKWVRSKVSVGHGCFD